MISEYDTELRARAEILGYDIRYESREGYYCKAVVVFDPKTGKVITESLEHWTTVAMLGLLKIQKDIAEALGWDFDLSKPFEKSKMHQFKAYYQVNRQWLEHEGEYAIDSVGCRLVEAFEIPDDYPGLHVVYSGLEIPDRSEAFFWTHLLRDDVGSGKPRYLLATDDDYLNDSITPEGPDLNEGKDTDMEKYRPYFL